MKKIDIEDWLTRLRDSRECESAREKDVMDAIRSGLSASEQQAEVDQLALQRLHRRIEQEGLYQTPVKRSRNLHRYGYAAVLLVGLTIILDLSVFDRSVINSGNFDKLSRAVPSDAARYEVAASAAIKDKAGRAEAEHELAHGEMSDERLLADFASMAKTDSAQANSAMLKSAPKPERLAAAPSAQQDKVATQGKTEGQNSVADTALAEATAGQNLNEPPRRLSLTDLQWQTIRALADEGISLEERKAIDHWILRLNSEVDQRRWRAALPDSQQNLDWPIRKDIALEVVISGSGDRND